MRLTWGEFKEALERNGVKDDTPIDYIDIDGWTTAEEISVQVEKDGGLRVSIG